jgi:hypothetical protein
MASPRATRGWQDLHTLSRFLIAHFPEHMATFQGVLGIPFKRGTQKLLQQSWNRVDHDEIHPALPCAGPSRRSGSIPGEPHPPLEQISVSRFRFPKGL